jgi:hypothetical protein
VSGRRTLIAAVVIVAMATGCVSHPVGPARTYGSYAAKASTTVESAISAVETVLLVAETAADGGTTGPYTSIAVSEQEDALGGVRGTFASIQPPPGARSARLRDELTTLLDQAFDHVGDVRIQARRGHLDRLDVVAAPLDADADALRELLDTLP